MVAVAGAVVVQANDFIQSFPAEFQRVRIMGGMEIRLAPYNECKVLGMRILEAFIINCECFIFRWKGTYIIREDFL